MSARPASSKAEARAEAQRERILVAAQQAFVEHGFHAASIASIAEKAGISAGLIYRYFENKNAIILAIVQRQLELLRNDIQLNRQLDLAGEIAAQFGRSCNADGRGMNSALLLEISAEATRDPQIAAALDEYDRTIRSAVRQWLVRGKDEGGHGLSPEVAPARALLLQCLIEGLKLRETREPDLDRALLAEALQGFIPALLRP